jgi:hypothetical protein
MERHDPKAQQIDTIDVAGRVGDLRTRSVVGGDSAAVSNHKTQEIPEKILEKLTKLEQSSLPKAEGHILNPTLTLTIVLGVFAVWQLVAAGISNDQSQTANQLALLTLCSSNFVRCLYSFGKNCNTNTET